MPGYTVAIENDVNTILVTTAETVIATLTGVSTSGAGKRVRLKGECKLTTGANTTDLNLRIRRDSLTGTETTESNLVRVEAAAPNNEDHDVMALDTPAGEIFNATYVLTLQQTAATADGLCLYAYLEAECE